MKMICKLMCFLGLHEWGMAQHEDHTIDALWYAFRVKQCKHCRRMK